MTTTTCLESDIREEVDKLSHRFQTDHHIEDEQEFCSCFGFAPSEDYEEMCQYAKRLEMQSDAYKDVMMAFLKYINVLTEQTDIMVRSRLAASAYEETFQAAITRFEKLESDLDKLELRDREYF